MTCVQHDYVVVLLCMHGEITRVIVDNNTVLQFLAVGARGILLSFPHLLRVSFSFSFIVSPIYVLFVCLCLFVFELILVQWHLSETKLPA